MEDSDEEDEAPSPLPENIMDKMAEKRMSDPIVPSQREEEEEQEPSVSVPFSSVEEIVQFWPRFSNCSETNSHRSMTNVFMPGTNSSHA